MFGSVIIVNDVVISCVNFTIWTERFNCLLLWLLVFYTPKNKKLIANIGKW
jgi:hypothetical protein